MTRLPSRLQPLWPLVKRLHRAASLWSGFVGRGTRWLQGDRALPRRGTYSVDRTQALEPDAVTIVRAPAGETIRRPVATGAPAEHWVFAAKRSFDVPARSMMDIASGTVVGHYGAVVTPGGTLDFETSDYFGVDTWREHPMYLRRRLPEIQDVDGTVLVLATRGGHNNYYHFLLDVLPRFGVLEETMPGREVDALYVPTATAWQKTLLGLAGLDGIPAINAGADAAVRATWLLVPSLPNPQEVAPPAAVSWLRARLRPSPDAGKTPRRVYVTRGQRPNSRRLVREEETLALLERQGFVCVEPGGLSPQEQIDLFSGAEVVVAPHGAAMTNLLFVPPGTRVLELFDPSYVNQAFWAITQAIPDTRYRYLVADGAERHGPGDPMNKILVDIDIPPAAVADAVDALLTD